MTQTIIQEGVEKNKAAIHNVLIKVAAALNKGEVETLLSLHTDDVILMEQGMPLMQGKAELREMFSAFDKRNYRIHISFETNELELMGFRSFVRGAVMVTKLETGKDPICTQGKFICILSQQADGRWLRSHIIANTDK